MRKYLVDLLVFVLPFKTYLEVLMQARRALALLMPCYVENKKDTIAKQSTVALVPFWLSKELH